MGPGFHHFFPKAKAAAWRGSVLALMAAMLFGISTPLVQRFGQHLGAWTTACLLYAGAAALALTQRRPAERESRLARADLPRLLGVAGLGAALGPAALAWGLQRTSATSASLMLTLEAVFTALLARLLYREDLGGRVVWAMALLLAGGALLVLDQGRAGPSQWMGLLAVLAATAAWGGDNALSRPLAQRDPAQVVLAKGLLGSCTCAVMAASFDNTLPSLAQAASLLAVGATGYGLSLRLYLLAQREVGAARTGSVFAFAPFVGALAAWVLGDRSASWLMGAGGLLMLGGVWLHLTESHEHEHTHEAMAHEHAHRHDDGHHDHAHEPTPVGEHSHLHVHEPKRHAHPHVPDAHHTHTH